MFLNQANKKAKRPAGKAAQEKAGSASAAGARKLYSAPVWLLERGFAGEFDIGDKKYKLIFIPSQAEIAGETLQLRGRLSILGGPDGRSLNNVRARLTGIQGGIGRGPAPYKMLATGATPGPTQSPTEKQQKAGENEKKAGEPAQPGKTKTGGLPPTESTGPTSFTAVMFFHLDPLDGSAFGVAADMSRVQLNARLAPQDPQALRLHSLYTALTNALAGEQADPALASALVRELNQILAG